MKGWVTCFSPGHTGVYKGYHDTKRHTHAHTQQQQEKGQTGQQQHILGLGSVLVWERNVLCGFSLRYDFVWSICGWGIVKGGSDFSAGFAVLSFTGGLDCVVISLLGFIRIYGIAWNGVFGQTLQHVWIGFSVVVGFGLCVGLYLSGISWFGFLYT
ncbi:hypothetical protein QBC36DRAFT_16045 [Triangularia setosa]|uniref:Uncharacterized protein n=1 Tax=Triangularia setosa TaxID=2587417 RepID=A0AAN7A5D5_9PEZI|nr:hypothetical protein QBC36DRAFT_16045 [Podospora setosa]